MLLNTFKMEYKSSNMKKVFEMKRQGEYKRYRAFKDLPNRMLLWHGSRNTNYAGILSQGLRIAPPEAPVTGYMFGKGIYFADMVSKSANYCRTTKSDPVGIMILSEVACGNMYELPHAKYVTDLPKGKHSTKGVGMHLPDPKDNLVTEDGVIVPLGKGVDSGLGQSSLLYNEYIVYDVSQVNMKYLLKLNFKFKW